MNPEIKSLIFQLIKNKPEITIGELSQVLNISSVEVFEFFHVMKEIEFQVKFENLGGLNHVEEEIVKILQEKSENFHFHKVNLHELAAMFKTTVHEVNRVTMGLRRKGYSVSHENAGAGIISVWLNK